MIEKAALFGASDGLAGIVTEPRSPGDARAVGVIVLSAGLLHRVGPNRLHVQVARCLAESGFWVLRFDFSGIGDSSPRRDKLPRAAASVSETIEAMEFLARTSGVERFLLIGLCSGADAAAQAAKNDRRVIGVGLIDYFYEPSMSYYLSSYSKLALRGRSWRRLLTRQSGFWSRLTGSVASLGKARRLGQVRAAPDRDQALADLRALVDRGVDLCLVFTSFGPAHYHYRRCFERGLPAPVDSARLRVDVVSGTDHVFTSRASQRALIGLLREWAEQGSRVRPSASA